MLPDMYSMPLLLTACPTTTSSARQTRARLSGQRHGGRNEGTRT
jgi:hypothetical protein